MKIMRERPPYNITPEQGWAQMQPILDKAMPVDPRSRKLILLWWLAGIVILASLLSLFLFKEKLAPAKTPVSSPQATEMAKAGNNEFNDQNQQTVNQAINTNENSSTSAERYSSASHSLKFDDKSSTLRHSNNSNSALSSKETLEHGHVGSQTDAVFVADQISSEGNENNNATNTNELNTNDRNNSATEFLPLVELASVETNRAAAEITDRDFSPSI